MITEGLIAGIDRLATPVAMRRLSDSGYLLPAIPHSDPVTQDRQRRNRQNTEQQGKDGGRQIAPAPSRLLGTGEASASQRALASSAGVGQSLPSIASYDGVPVIDSNRATRLHIGDPCTSGVNHGRDCRGIRAAPCERLGRMPRDASRLPRQSYLCQGDQEGTGSRWNGSMQASVRLLRLPQALADPTGDGIENV